MTPLVRPSTGPAFVAAAALGLTLPFAGTPAASASTRNYLTVEGQVLDTRGRALPETWVMCTGSRRSSAMADSSGHYRLEIPGATLEELETTPLKIRIQALRKGWRFSLEGGAPELGLELRVVKDEARLSRLLMRSNDAAALDSVANSVVLEANPRALIEAVFVGSQGARFDAPPAPLDVSEEITLAGGESIPELELGGAAATTEPLAGQPQSGPPSSPPAASSQAQGSKPPPAQPGAAAPAPPKPPATGSATAGPAPTKSTAAPVPAPASSSSPSGGSPPAPTTKSSTVTQSSPGSATTGSKDTPGDGGSKKKWNAAGSGEGSKPKVVRPALEPSASATSGDKASQNPPASGDAKKDASASATAKSTAGSDPSLKPVASKQVPVSGVTPHPPGVPPAVPVTPSQPPTQPVSRPGSTSAGGAGASKSDPSMCDCTLRGTVEVQSDQPLSSRTEVVLAVEGAPEIAASVELFMGSPRAFEVRRAPCGDHRLLLWTRSRQRFALLSAEPRVTCSPGSLQQLRLVLEPVARWGTAR